jgi:phosphoribosylformylglycinamidine synthase PurS subunit
MRVRVLVRLRPGIMDVQGAAVQRALIGLGFGDLRDLRVGKVVDVEVDAPNESVARSRVDEMCKKLLANPVLEDYSIETIEGVSLAASSAVR